MAFFSKVRGLLQHKMTNNMGREISATSPFIFEAIRCMSSKLFVGGLSYQTSEEALRQAFEKYGEVYEARIILDRQTGNSRGFGFVTFESTEAANSAIMALDGQDLDGRRLKVNQAHDRGQGYGGGRGYSSNSNFGGGYGGGTYQGGGYGNYGGGDGNHQGGGYGNYGGGNYQGGGGYDNYGGNNQGSGQGDQGTHNNNPGGDGGYSTPGGGSYSSNYASSGGNYGDASSNYPSTGGNLESDANFSNTNAFDGGANSQNFGAPAAGGGNSQNFGAPAAGGGNYNFDGSNYGNNFTSSGYENNNGLSSEGGHQFSNNANSDVAYEDEPDGYQDRRAS